MTYQLTFFVKALPPNAAGESRGPIIRILESHKDDVGLYKHELEHVKQWFKLSLLGIPVAAVLFHIGRIDLMAIAVLPLSFHSLLYALSNKYRLWAEVSAYKVQALYYPDDRRPLFAGFIAGYYDLNITTNQALDALNRK